MFSLIATLLSIALVAALALATMYYGGNAYHNWQNAAKAATLASQASQVYAAAQLWYQDKNTWPASPECLLGTGQGPSSCNANTTQYLSGVPVPPQGALIAAADYTLDAAFAQMGPGPGLGGGFDPTWTFVLDDQGTLTYLNIANLIAQDVCHVVEATARGSGSLLTLVPYETQVQDFKDNFESMFAAEISNGVTPSQKIAQIGITLDDWYAGDPAGLEAVTQAPDAAALKTALLGDVQPDGVTTMLDVLAKAAVIPPSVDPSLVYQCVDQGLSTGGASTFTYFWKTPVATDPCSAVGVYNAEQLAQLGCGGTPPPLVCPAGQYAAGNLCLCDVTNMPPDGTGQCSTTNPGASCPAGQHWQDGNTTCLCDYSNQAPDGSGQCPAATCSAEQTTIGFNGKTLMLDFSPIISLNNDYSPAGPIATISGGGTELQMALNSSGGTVAGFTILDAAENFDNTLFSGMSKVEIEFDYMFESSSADSLLDLTLIADFYGSRPVFTAIGVTPASTWQTVRIQTAVTAYDFVPSNNSGIGVDVFAYRSNPGEFTGSVKLRNIKYRRVDEAKCICPSGFPVEPDGQCYTYTCYQQSLWHGTTMAADDFNIRGEGAANYHIVNEFGRPLSGFALFDMGLAGQASHEESYYPEGGINGYVTADHLLTVGHHPVLLTHKATGATLTCPFVLTGTGNGDNGTCLRATPYHGPAAGGNLVDIDSFACDTNEAASYFFAGPGGEPPMVTFKEGQIASTILPSAHVTLISDSKIRVVAPPSRWNEQMAYQGPATVWASSLSDNAYLARPTWYAYDGPSRTTILYGLDFRWVPTATLAALPGSGVDSRGLLVKELIYSQYGVDAPSAKWDVTNHHYQYVPANLAGQGPCNQGLLGALAGWNFDLIQNSLRITVDGVDASILGIITNRPTSYTPSSPWADDSGGAFDTAVFKLPAMPASGVRTLTVSYVENGTPVTVTSEWNPEGIPWLNKAEYSDQWQCSLGPLKDIFTGEGNFWKGYSLTARGDPGSNWSFGNDLLVGHKSNLASMSVNGIPLEPRTWGGFEATLEPTSHPGIDGNTYPIDPAFISGEMSPRGFHLDSIGWQPVFLTEAHKAKVPLFDTGLPSTLTLTVGLYTGQSNTWTIQALRTPIDYDGGAYSNPFYLFHPERYFDPANLADADICPVTCADEWGRCQFACAPYYSINGDSNLRSLRQSEIAVIACNGGVLSGITCTCPATQVLVNGSCGCPAGTVWNTTVGSCLASGGSGGGGGGGSGSFLTTSFYSGDETTCYSAEVNGGGVGCGRIGMPYSLKSIVASNANVYYVRTNGFGLYAYPQGGQQPSGASTTSNIGISAIDSIFTALFGQHGTQTGINAINVLPTKNIVCLPTNLNVHQCFVFDETKKWAVIATPVGDTPVANQPFDLWVSHLTPNGAATFYSIAQTGWDLINIAATLTCYKVSSDVAAPVTHKDFHICGE